MLLELGSYRFKHIVLCLNSGELILLAQCCKPTNFINLEIIGKWMGWNSPEKDFKRQKHFIFPNPTLSSCRTTVFSRKVSLPADSDPALSGKWKDVPRWNSWQCLKNPSELANIGKLYQSGDAIPGQSHFRFYEAEFDFHLLRVTLSKKTAFCGNASRISLC